MSQFVLPDETKRAIIEQRLAQFNAEGYQHELNLQTAQLAGNTEQVEASEAAITVLQEAISAHEAILAEIAPAQ